MQLPCLGIYYSRSFRAGTDDDLERCPTTKMVETPPVRSDNNGLLCFLFIYLTPYNVHCPLLDISSLAHSRLNCLTCNFIPLVPGTEYHHHGPKGFSLGISSHHKLASGVAAKCSAIKNTLNDASSSCPYQSGDEYFSREGIGPVP